MARRRWRAVSVLLFMIGATLAGYQFPRWLWLIVGGIVATDLVLTMLLGAYPDGQNGCALPVYAPATKGLWA